MNVPLAIQAAVASLLAPGLAASVTAQPAKQETRTEKCYGVANAGQSDCGTSKHAYAGLGSKAANDPTEWKSVLRSTCETPGGTTTAAQ